MKLLLTVALPATPLVIMIGCCTGCYTTRLTLHVPLAALTTSGERNEEGEDYTPTQGGDRERAIPRMEAISAARDLAAASRGTPRGARAPEAAGGALEAKRDSEETDGGGAPLLLLVMLPLLLFSLSDCYFYYYYHHCYYYWP